MLLNYSNPKNNNIFPCFSEMTHTPTCFDCFTGKNWGFYSLGDKYDFLRARGGDSYQSPFNTKNKISAVNVMFQKETNFKKDSILT